MDFTALPPEVNSVRIYTGPGSGPLLAAAAAWETVAAELQTAAGLYETAITALTAGPWLGPSAAQMAAATAPYVGWMRLTATQAEQTATQAAAAAAAYDSAFAATVPPPVVAANRALLMALIATNFFGQNLPAIMATEMQYAEMWAQDAGAMLGYAAASASATALTPFTPPSSTTDAAAPVSQAAAVSQAASTTAGSAQSTVSNAAQAFSAVPNTLTGLAAPAAATDALSPLDTLDILGDLSGIFLDPGIGTAGLTVDGILAGTALPYGINGYFVGLHTDDIVSGWAGIETWPGSAPVPPTPFPVITDLGSTAAAGLGEASTVGALSVPQGWVAAAPEIRLAATALPATAAAAAAEASGAGSLFSQMALAGLAGRAAAGTGGGGGGGRRERLAERVGAVTRKPAEGAQVDTPEPPPSPPVGGPITSIAAELRELASLRDAGILTEAEFTEQKQRLLAH
ncbi:hypothetical protein MKUB_27560 [Mycobacterium kubicae]|uniref:PPE domain-containing protein n=1 Tax=Mycobacterium kubicae TaxID=120959 RepID=A0AAX1J3F8_9MYCO|nr:PPE domain-containing protein [Mycobacterium kubicae]MCV7096122.1 PPE domain-containing protein [Mycobacterium kubicae]ORV99206.1 hypothetical protein AWC13_10630 [Mycobacterium kubicae]QNI12273.1 PPE domain-containing protein [Mycobacterium kubicae]QPI35791.1 PPE domain-containing protein [Mycobacterium kubicae]GFG65266.1 hypothetical protein MKUB_27560 [Mycobacterium kubicae]